MRKIEELDTCYNRSVEVNKIQEKIDRLRARITSTTRPLDGNPRNHGQEDVMARYAAELDELERQQEIARELLRPYQESVEDRLWQLPVREAEVLRCRYAKGLSWRQVVKKVQKSRSRVFALHRQGIERYRAISGLLD